jgi:hypothetical protein
MCSNPLSTQVMEDKDQPMNKEPMENKTTERATTTPPPPAGRKSSLMIKSPVSVVLHDGTSADGTAMTTTATSTTTTTAMTTASATTTANKKQVTFATIFVREHAVILGDNPGLRLGGPPVTIDWQAQRQYQMNLDEYETAVGNSRRTAQELRMPAVIRQGMLEGDCNMAEMKRAAAAAKKIRGQRQFTMAMADSAESVEVFCASVARKLKRTFQSRRKSRVKSTDSNDQMQKDAAANWIEQQMPRTSRRATFPTLLVSKNTRRNSLRASFDDVSLGLSSLRSSATEDEEAEEARIVAAVARMTVSE